jgi:hypothetical protein
MFAWRNALVLGVIFAAVGIVYWYVQGNGSDIDRAGVTMLILLGVAMAFVFMILLRGSREL